MTTNTPDIAVSPENDENPSYTFDPDLIANQGRSVGVVLGTRLCEAARAKLKGAPEDLSYRELHALFRAHCSGQEGYLSPQHPVLETVARILLTAPEDALPLSEIYEQVSSLWLTSAWSPSLDAGSMRRLLDHARAHGIARA
ncbi:MAG: hypothetical protein OXE50_10310 [Chloroflexi bacterium]|nr:hypothetical protein [Chloroflexota bacterium]